MDEVDRRIINALQGGFPICPAPYAAAARTIGIDQDDLLQRLRRLRADGLLSRFGPMYHAEKLGGALTLAAMAVPEGRFDAVAEQVNAHREVAHNYAREHHLNMWFVLATEQATRIGEVIAEIEAETGLAVFNMPKQEEFFIGLRFEA
ncbi:MAG: AsnC family transcriptional regulator [Alphaproteobacteria bacterium]|nr:AsnC family transcriptional regulator [Alphaproteobacteria bacterium]